VHPPRLADWTPEQGDVQRNNDYIQYTSHAFRRILCKPIIGAVAAKLAGTSAIRIFQATLLYKPPIGDEPTNVVSWHYDSYYWSTCSSTAMLTAFIPFHDCDERHGTLTMIDGSHRWSSRHGTDRPTGPDGDLARDYLLQRDAEASGAEIHRIPVRIPRGHMTFHHCLLYHGSGSNTSGEPRQSISLHLQDAANTYRPYAESAGRHEPYKHDWLVRRDAAGLPDYTDPGFCPQVWPDVAHSGAAARNP
jgi:ectoine hydroxylase-related dioxygenase (phytanoyl-CoA dioxygenase family)